MNGAVTGLEALSSRARDTAHASPPDAAVDGEKRKTRAMFLAVTPTWSIGVITQPMTTRPGCTTISSAVKIASRPTGSKLRNSSGSFRVLASWPGRAGSFSAARSAMWHRAVSHSSSTSDAARQQTLIHTSGQEIQPDARTVYVDNDELVLSHAQNILAKSEDV